ERGPLESVPDYLIDGIPRPKGDKGFYQFWPVWRVSRSAAARRASVRAGSVSSEWAATWAFGGAPIKVRAAPSWVKQRALRSSSGPPTTPRITDLHESRPRGPCTL